MPKLTVTVEHSLGAEEAVRRIKEKQETVVATSEVQVTNLEIDWNGNDMDYQFQVFGAKISGTMAVTDTDVTTNMSVPLLAMAMKGRITSQVEDRLNELLS